MSDSAETFTIADIRAAYLAGQRSVLAIDEEEGRKSVVRDERNFTCARCGDGIGKHRQQQRGEQPGLYCTRPEFRGHAYLALSDKR